MTTTMTLSPESQELFVGFANDADNWSGTPLVDIAKNQRWNLTDLKKKGLIKTTSEEGETWCWFTMAGIELAKELGIDLSWITYAKPSEKLAEELGISI